MPGPSAHVAPVKKREVAELVRILRESPVVAVASIEAIPSPSIQKIRRNLRKDATIRVSKNTLLALALKEAAKEKPALESLAAKINGPTAVIATSLSPFKLYRRLEGSKARAPAKGGETAPEDVWVRQGETAFKPGPIVGELQKAGIPAKIDQGKVVISADKLVVKAGDKIPQPLAAALTRLEIHPLIIGMNVQAAYESGMIYEQRVLQVDEKQLLAQIGQAARAAVNLSVNAGYPTKKTIEILLQKAHREALAVGLEAEILDTKVIDLLLAKGQAEMLAVARKASPEALDEELKSKLG
ncbi:MAG TPA: 50S ribosomal protein L10 [Candidatus Thermoplasmatota archaeon]|nr:50S ribosomal protein L10 [Candidatus Thermoplasmatota archaeon]